MIIDTHAHYDDEAFDSDRANVLETLSDKGISHCVNISASVASIDETLKLVEGYKNVFGALGVHPDEIADMDESVIKKMIESAKHPKIVAIGEIGLDYYHGAEEVRGVQKEWFIRQIGVARETGLPLVIHSREAAMDTMNILKQYHAEEIGGVIHCYSYHVDMAREYVKMGFYLGVGGVLTYNNARKLVEVVQNIPLEHIVLETDSPYLSPVPVRRGRNDSTNLKYVAAKMAELTGYSVEEVEKITSQNAMKLYPKMGEMILNG